MLSKKFVFIIVLTTIQCLLIKNINSIEIDHSFKEINNKNNNYNYKNVEFLKRNIKPDIILLTRKQQENKIDSLNTFLTFWNEIEDKNYETTKDIPFTIIIPNIIDAKNNIILKERLEEFLLEHIVPGYALETFNENDIYGNLNKNKIQFNEKYDNISKDTIWLINNDVKILNIDLLSDNMSIIYIDGYLGDWKNTFSKRNIQEKNSYNEPQRLEMKNVTKHDNVPVKENKISHLMNFLAGMKTGTKVFQHFLTKSNLTQILDDSTYTVLIPSDNAFQRWHPIDWGFYPFSVQEFTEGVLRNHFLQLRTPLRMGDVKNMNNEQKYKTVGGETVVFKNYPTPNVNNVTILSDYTLPNGNEVFLISEVLFVSEAVVSRLHQMHKDKETPPLLAFPWFGAQFLSHSFLALERDSRFTQITRYLNTAEIAPFVSGSNFTFFVPTDTAFEKIGYDILSDDILASEKGVKMLLNHFVKGRLYDRDLKHDEVFEALGGGYLKIGRMDLGNVTVNKAHIIESEIFVYNLGTMFYIDEILYSDIINDEISTTPHVQKATSELFDTLNNGPATSEYKESSTKVNDPSTISTHLTAIHTNKLSVSSTFFPPSRDVSTIAADVEIVPSEFTEQSGNDDDFLLQDDEIVTPKALPITFDYYSPKK